MPSSWVNTLPDDILIDTAILECDLVTPGTYVLVGGTRGGLTFNPGKTFRAVPYDGKRSAHVVGLDRIEMVDPKITGTLIAFNGDTLRMMEAASTGTVGTITPKPMGEMFVLGDYHKFRVTWNRAQQVAGVHGTVVVEFSYGYVESYDIKSADNNEGESPIVIVAAQRRDDTSSTDGELPYTIAVTTAA